MTAHDRFEPNEEMSIIYLPDKDIWVINDSKNGICFPFNYNPSNGENLTCTHERTGITYYREYHYDPLKNFGKRCLDCGRKL